MTIALKMSKLHVGRSPRISHKEKLFNESLNISAGTGTVGSKWPLVA